MENIIKRMVLYLAFAAVICKAADDEKSFEGIDIKELESNPDRLQALVDCLMDVKPCHELDGRYKVRAAGIIASGCSDCSQKEKQIVRDAAWLVITRKSQFVRELVSKYDKGGLNAKKTLDSFKDVPSLINLPAVSGVLLDGHITKITNTLLTI